MRFDRNDHHMAPRCWERAPSTTSVSDINVGHLFVEAKPDLVHAPGRPGEPSFNCLF